jgi:hypothetical protein
VYTITTKKNIPGRQEKKEKNGKREDRKTRRGGGGRGIWDK